MSSKAGTLLSSLQKKKNREPLVQGEEHPDLCFRKKKEHPDPVRMLLPMLAASVACVRRREPGQDSASGGFVRTRKQRKAASRIYRPEQQPTVQSQRDTSVAAASTPYPRMHMPLFVSGLCSAPRRGRPGRQPLPWTEELGSSPGSLWFLATAPHGSRRRRAAEGAAKNAAEVGQVTAGGRETTDPAARARAHAPGAWHHQPACRGPTCLTRAGESDPGTRRRAPCPCRGRQGLGRRASEAAKWRPVCAASWLPGHWGLHARGGGTRAGRRRAGRLPTCMRNHVRVRADAAAWPCRAPKGRGAPAGLRAQCARI